MIETLLEKCRAQELSLEQADLVTDKCQEIEVELMQLHANLDVARCCPCVFFSFYGTLSFCTIFRASATNRCWRHNVNVFGLCRSAQIPGKFVSINIS